MMSSLETALVLVVWLAVLVAEHRYGGARGQTEIG